LKKNDRVVTTSGMVGTVANISQDGKEITLKFGDTTRIPFLRSAIETVLRDEPASAETAAKT
jgi:preprotein translocase subunit YajC